MTGVTLPELQAFASDVAGPLHDAASESGLARALGEYQAERREPVAGVTLSAGGRTFTRLFDALRDREVTFWEAELAVTDAPAEAAAWEWMLPIARIVFAADGSAEVHRPDGGPPQRVIARLLLRDAYRPPPAGDGEGSTVRTEPGAGPGLLPLAMGVAFVRRAKFVPFSAALLLYGPDERFRIDIDLLDSTVLRDPRAGRLPLARKVRRTSRVAHTLDTFLARGELSVRTARVIEALVESHGLTPFEVSQIFGGVPEFGSSALRSLAARGLATMDRQTGVYRPRFDGFEPAMDRPTTVREDRAPMPNPALRTSVMELLAAADSRATCPLCGDPLPPGPRRGMLCARCQADVGGAPA